MPGGLPAGHPNIYGNGPATRPAAKFGTVMLRAYQGTKDAPAIGETRAVLELYHRGQVLAKVEGTLDASGSLVFTKLPLDVPFQPVVMLRHSGVDYTAVGEVMDGYHAGQELEVPVYETTEKQPAWDVEMRHVIVEPAAEAVRVTEMLVVANPTDRTWLGAPQKDGKRVSFAIPLPAGASQVEFGNGADGSVKFEAGRVVNALPLQPGSTQYQLTYVVPVVDGKAKVQVVAPAPTRHMMVFVADNGSPVTAEGLQASGKHDMGNGAAALVFGGADLKANQVAAVNIALPKPIKKGTVGSTTDGARIAKIVAGAGGAVGLVIGVGYVVFKPIKAARI
jgi:hypothetical protein